MKLSIEKTESLACGTERHHLSNGWLAFRLHGSDGREVHVRGHRYSVWVPGRGKGADATFVCGAATIKAALALASARQEAADAALARMAFGGEYR